MEPANIHQDTSAIWGKLIKPTYRAHLFDEVSTPLKCNLLGEKDGLYMLVLLASPRWRWCLGELYYGSIQNIMLYETNKYSPGHQSHLREANKTNIRAHIFHQVSCTLKAYLLRQKDGLYMLVLLASPIWRWCPGDISWLHT